MTLNERLERARDAVKACIQNFRGCGACPYDNDFDTYECRKVFGDDLIELLTPEEPRLVTREDFEREPAWDGVLPCWKETRSPTRRNGWVAIVYGKALQDTETGMVRYWTGVPTEEQRREIAWPGA